MMHLPFLLLLLLLILYHSANIATALCLNVLTQGSSLHVENEDCLISPNRRFTAGFHRIGLNAYCFAIWFSEPLSDVTQTFVWMANRDEPVNGRRSKVSLWKNGNLVLKDVNRIIWTTNTQSSSSLELQLLDSGNLVLMELDNRSYLWQSFNFPTNTILPNQLFTKDTFLISSKSSTNFSSGYYKLYFDNDNVIRVVYNNDEITSVYFPYPWLLTWEAGRTTYNSSKIAMLDSIGQFISSDQFSFNTADYGDTLQRRLTLDVDGNIRVYSLNKKRWIVSWQAISKPCAIPGNCGPNSLCTYSSELGRSCACMHGYKAKNVQSDSWLGCEPTFDLSHHPENYDFIRLPYVEFIGFDLWYFAGDTLNNCMMTCLLDNRCKAFQYGIEGENGEFRCYTKNLLVNGIYKGNPVTTYLKLPKTDVSSYHQKVANETHLHCSNSTIELKRTYDKPSENGSLEFMRWFSIILGVIEGACFLFFYYVTKIPSGASATTQNYLAVATGFRRFTYDEMMNASHKFRDEIGRGGGGVVYKGILPDNRVVAIKRLHEAFHGEAEFLAEMSTIGRINHKNLIETYGYCAEGKHRILVYEYMENDTLAKNLGANQLDWHKRIEIASGVAKGLAYLHEECLEWVLHCDVKPHNILLDADYNPKIADFGLSKLFNQAGVENSIFSKIRGTRGYMAPEWVFNLPITSKVDVYSYGMVVLEMITGRCPTSDPTSDDNQSGEQKTLVSWVRDKVQEEGLRWTEKQIMDILDPMIRDRYEKGLIKNLLTVALQCVEEDKDARPTMSEVVKMLLSPDIDDASSI